LPGVRALGAELVARGVRVLTAGIAIPGAITLPTITTDPVIEPLLLAQSGYRLIGTAAVARGHDPDRPPFLAKVTETH
jgi:glutamine---fructose-6-phosphate transaminase (isomerizing)